MRAGLLTLSAVLVLTSLAGVAAQEAKPAFELVSIKESPPPTAGGGGTFSFSLFIGTRPGGRFEANNATVFWLLQYAYDGFSLPGQIVGGPAWTDAFDARFQVNALAAGEPSRAQMQEMVKAMLADRFKLKVRIESREMDVYALVLARRDGTLGRGVRPTTLDCDALSAAQKAGDKTVRTCGTSGMMNNGSTQKFTGTGVTMATVASIGQSTAGRPIIDRTGLTGRYDVELEYAGAMGRAGGAGILADSPAASIFTALPEQLGLKLDAAKETMNVLVIEQVEKPTPD